MCLAATALGLLATGVSAVGSVVQGNAAASAANAQAAQMENNAKLAEIQAREEVKRGASEEERFRFQIQQLRGKQKAGYAAAGIDLGSGSALDANLSTLTEAEMDAATIRADAQGRKHAYLVQAQDSRYQASLARASAKNARIGGYLGAATSIIGGVSTVADKWNWGKSAAKAKTATGYRLPTPYGYQYYTGKELKYY